MSVRAAFLIYHNPEVFKIISNAVDWVAPVQGPTPVYGSTAPLENIWARLAQAEKPTAFIPGAVGFSFHNAI
ncbi:hypothetical protein EHV15_16105 [Paenibacillus oralis]|uniref:Uncharacterized protein n=1 Tax=Paenibacillus oralis TaxID=2490856 RepID=A0A3P3U1P8_9BACL|nr:hypothetical protein [Paenibacillus oralis]RRJ64275.1 hypothetical protein EHV15_16105 [Paenibacillus oralis]